MENIAGKVVVITGASSGLGEAAARQLVQQGARVALGARRLDRLQTLAAELGEANASAFRVDVTDQAQVAALVGHAIERFGHVDVMVNNAGIMPLSPLEMLRCEEWSRCIDVNIKGVLWGIAAALPHFKQQRRGQFINVSSVAGHRIPEGGAIYSATKHAVRVISEALRREVKPYNIRTTVISPGAISTELPDSVTAPGVKQAVDDLYRSTAIPADSFARCVSFAIGQPEDVDVNEIVYRPTRQML